MSETRYEVIECELGKKNLEAMLVWISLHRAKARVISIIQSTGGGISSMLGSGMPFEYLIVIDNRSETQ